MLLRLLILILVFSLTACYSDNEEELYKKSATQSGQCADSINTYTLAVRPVMDAHCVVCHGGSNATGGVILDNHAAVARYAKSGRLMACLQYTDCKMPPVGKLPDSLINKVAKWVDCGALNN